MVAALSACDNKKNANNAAPIDDEEEELAVAAPDTKPDAEPDADEADFDDEEEVELTAEERERYENEVWPYLGGTYAFGDGDGHNVIVDVDLDDCQNEEEVLRCTLTIADEAFAGTIDTHTGCITCRDNNGNEVFQGYMFNGGNLLRGCLNGKPVRYEGLCGL